MPTVVWLKILKAVDEVSRENPLKVAPVKEVIKRLDIAEYNVRNLLSRMKKEGLVENPIYGCYRLTEKGRKYLESPEKLFI